MQKPERSMKRPLRRKSNLERRRMIATETVASKIGGAPPGKHNDRGFQLLARRTGGILTHKNRRIVEAAKPGCSG